MILSRSSYSPRCSSRQKIPFILFRYFSTFYNMHASQACFECVASKRSTGQDGRVEDDRGSRRGRRPLPHRRGELSITCVFYSSVTGNAIGRILVLIFKPVSSSWHSVRVEKTEVCGSANVGAVIGAWLCSGRCTSRRDQWHHDINGCCYSWTSLKEADQKFMDTLLFPSSF